MTLTVLVERRATARAPSARRESAVAIEVELVLPGTGVNGPEERELYG